MDKNPSTPSKRKQSAASRKSNPTSVDSETIAEFSKTGLSLITNAIKAVNGFPTGSARDFYCTCPTFGKIIDAQSDRILELLSGILKKQNIRGNIQRRQRDEQFEMLLECNDVMLERINSNLDELAGIKKDIQTVLIESKLQNNSQKSLGAGSWNLKKNDNMSITNARLITAKNIARPQTSFKIPVDNKSDSPFEPRIKEKPNSIKPLAVLPEYDDDGNIESYLHPYEFELDKFEPPKEQLNIIEPEPPKDIKGTPLLFVDNKEKLHQAIEEIRNEAQIAVDLEHHSYRTFQGITCLMQISTKAKDYIIDTLSLREELHALNEVFTNPKVVKIFHGADQDVQWLQRDLSLYVVNMFDTHQAAKLLTFPRLSLSYLLKRYCNIDADKTFQLADWRIRPLPQELIAYARQDTHYLIYIYEMLRNEILGERSNGEQVLKMVYKRSVEVCKTRYMKPKISADSYMELYRKSKRILDNRQLYALKEIFLWRDKTARLEDESYGFVLPNHMMFQISETLPREMQGILACCNPIPPLVRQQLHALHQIVLKAREQPLLKPLNAEYVEKRIVLATTKEGPSKLDYPHDMSHNPEFRDDLLTLLGPIKCVKDDCGLDDVEMATPTIELFNQSSEETKADVLNKLKLDSGKKFVSPFYRYKATLPFLEKQRLEELEKLNEEDKKRKLCPVKEEKEDTEIKEIEEKKPEDIFSQPMKASMKRKRKENDGNAKQSHNLKQARVDDLNGEQDKLDFIEKPKAVKESSKEKGSMFSIQVKGEPEPNVEIDGNNTESAAAESMEPFNSRKNAKPRNKKRKALSKSAQGSNQPVQFDFSQVDYKKFQGGSKRAKATQINPKFHGKGQGNKGNNKKFNKLFTFSNVKNNKK